MTGFPLSDSFDWNESVPYIISILALMHQQNIIRFNLQCIAGIHCLPHLDGLLQTPSPTPFHVSEGSNMGMDCQEVKEQQNLAFFIGILMT